MKYLIVGLGNIGREYENTRHNIGFNIADQLAKSDQAIFSTEKHSQITSITIKGRTLHIIKPTTYMNLSGKAVSYWLQQLKVTPSNMLVLVDDLALPFGTLRLKPKGSDAGHNGLKDIQAVLGNNDYPRLRFGIGNNYPKGRQVDYVLGAFSKEEQSELPILIDQSIEIIKSFVTAGIEITMTNFNK